MLSIKSVLVPFRLSLSARKPISLRTEITNNSEDAKKVSVKLIVSRELSVERTGIANIFEKRVGVIEPGQTKLLYLDIYPKAQTSIRDYPARVVIYEHYDDFDFVDKEYKKDFRVIVQQ